MSPSDLPPTSDSPADSKQQARWRAEEARLKRFEHRQARRWRAQNQRPPSVLVATLALTTLAVLAMGAAPFIALQEQIYGRLPVIGRPLAAPAVVFGLVLLPLGILIGQARNWARWGVTLIGVAMVAITAYPEPTLWTLLPGAILLVYLILLFNPEANRFFR